MRHGDAVAASAAAGDAANDAAQFAADASGSARGSRHRHGGGSARADPKWIGISSEEVPHNPQPMYNWRIPS